MVELDKIRSSNQKLPTTLPSGLVAVFVGATNGIGEHTIKAFVKYTVKPRVYLVGRSKEAADRILKELKTINTSGEYIAIQEDVSLITVVDRVCKQIKAKETSINLLFQTQGSLAYGTGEFLHLSSKHVRFLI